MAHDPQVDSLGTEGLALHEVTVVGDKMRHMNEAVKLDLKTNPVRSSQEVLRIVPGLFIAQHAGGGKAEQMFLRGYDLDHGTDINISVDGMPVNMLSHAHGQGYADLHFLMPELINMVDFDKGTFDITKGDLATAGYVAFRTKDRVANEAGVELGLHNFQRYHSMMQLINETYRSMYVAGSFLTDDGFFDADQNFKRFNLMSKYTQWGETSTFNVILSHFNSNWNASGQIPERAVDKGLIGWFGSLDPSEGGNTSRTNLQFTHHLHLPEGAMLNTNLWTSYYTFDLFSNFTFYLNDQDNGDEIHQTERRFIAGGNSEYTRPLRVNDNDFKAIGGVGFRYDAVKDLGLYHAVQRNHIGTYALGDVHQSSLFAYAGIEMNLGEHWTIYPGARVDWFKMDYWDKTVSDAPYTNPNASQAKVSPKLNIIYSPNRHLELLAKFGRGFHSNDARVVVIKDGKETLPGVTGIDLGMKWKPTTDLLFNLTGWYLHSEQEFVYVGDEAIVEPSGRSRRFGIDVGLRYTLFKNLYFQADYTWCNARSIDEPKGEDYIPLAPVNTLVAGLSWDKGPFSASIKGRWLGDRPANEDYSLTAEGYFIVDVNASYKWKAFTFGAAIDNLFNTKWKEAQFATETLIPGDDEPITDICFTPGTPFMLRGFVSVRF